MNLIEKLDKMKHLADTTDTGDDERTGTHETFEFVFELEKAWPKLREMIFAYDNWLDLFMQDGREDLEDDGSLEKAVKRLDDARRALSEPENP